mgnify:CR=1 FL=1
MKFVVTGASLAELAEHPPRIQREIGLADVEQAGDQPQGVAGVPGGSTSASHSNVTSCPVAKVGPADPSRNDVPYPVTTEEGARAAVRELALKKPDFVKIHGALMQGLSATAAPPERPSSSPDSRAGRSAASRIARSIAFERPWRCSL